MRILAVKTHAAGDLLLTTPALRALRQGFPKADIVLVTGSANVDVALCMPGIAAYLFVDAAALLRRNIAAVYEFYNNIRHSGADLIILFQPSAQLSRLISLTGPPVYAPVPSPPGPKYLAGSVKWQPNGEKYIAENYVELAEAAGGVRDGLDLDFVIPPEVPAAAELTGLPEETAYVVVAPCGGRNPREEVEAKLPPLKLFDHIVELITRTSGRDVVIVGGAGDEERCETLAGGTVGRRINLAGKTDIAETARVISRAAYVVTVDSLPLHIAAAFHKPTLALFAPTNPRALIPPAGTVTAVAAELECAPCYANAAFPGCKRHDKYACRERIPLEPIEEFISQMEKR